ncbi:microfibril-associated glycoprotein 4-like [Asterias amurensis]|uniref:microfibril-associated glycoprotein 4-like n=1 Tax=Asterias amurensis TaxID=7602 RepID=UPI003AB1C722
MGLITAFLLSCLALYCSSQNPIRFASSGTQFAAENRALVNHTFHWKTVSSHVVCGRDCLLDSKCESFNYHTSKRMCELNDASRAYNSSDLLKLRESLYFDYSSDTGLLSVPLKDFVKYSDCSELYQAGYRYNGVFTIYPITIVKGLQVYCDLETVGGGWIVFQSRQDGSVGFNRTWAEYQSGFGDLHTEFWLGNDALRDLTSTGTWKLRVDIEHGQEGSSWATYDGLVIQGALYTLYFDHYSGGLAGDALAKHKGVPFSTYDKDNDQHITINCGHLFGGGWWFTGCFEGYLNGIYHHTDTVEAERGVHWSTWKGFKLTMKKCSMKIQREI